jgi:hypothetical protein
LRLAGPFATARLRYVQARDDYVLVFILILLAISLISIVPTSGPGGLLVTAVQSLTLLLTLRTAGVNGRALGVLRILALVPVLAVLGAIVSQQPVGPFYYASMILLIVGTQAAIVVHALRRGKVTADTVMGALCIYLLLGLLFATADAFYNAEVVPFFAQQGAHSASDFVYYSFITLTTVGYGDLTPGTGVARVFAVAEALLGQLYLVTVISLLVGNLGAQRLQGTPKEPEGD